MISLPRRIVAKRTRLVCERSLYQCASRVIRAVSHFMLSAGMAAFMLHASAAAPPGTVAPAVAGAAADARGGAEPVALAAQQPVADPAKIGGKAQETALNNAAPTAAECKAVYPLGAQVDAVRRIEYRDIAPAQAAQVSSEKSLPVKPLSSARATFPGAKQAVPAKSEVAELRHGLKVDVAQLPALMRLLECAGKKRELVLFLAGRPLPGLTAYPPMDPQQNSIIFLLERTENNYEAWTHLLGRPAIRPVRVNVSIGFDDSYAIPSSATMDFRAIPVGWSLTWLCLILVFSMLILWAGRNSGMLRDSGIVDSDRKAMFSLARVQLTYWTFIVLGSLVFIGMITGDYLNSMNEKVLALMGISVGTSLGSSIIDNGASGTALRAALPSTGVWWRDILSDGKDISIHRFQMVAWTIVFGVVFLHQVYSKLAMPELPVTLLGLMGVSAGTYLGLKVTLETPPGSASAGAGAERNIAQGAGAAAATRNQDSHAATPAAGAGQGAHTDLVR